VPPNPDISALIPTASQGRLADSARKGPSDLALLGSLVSAERDTAWGRFVGTYTPLLLRVARVVVHEHDAARSHTDSGVIRRRARASRDTVLVEDQLGVGGLARGLHIVPKRRAGRGED